MQRVREAEVTVDGAAIGRIRRGLVLLVGLAVDDSEDAVVWMARKIIGLRIFDDQLATGQRSVLEAGAELLAVSQFTVVADCSKGRRPSYDRAMPAAAAAGLFERLVTELRSAGGAVATGRFGATMQVRLVNDSPMTVVLDSPTPARGVQLRPGQNSVVERRLTT